MQRTFATLGALVVLIGAARAHAQDAGAPAAEPCASVAPGTPEAEPCAEAAFRAADASGQAFEGFALSPPPPYFPPASSLPYLVAQIQTGSTRAQSVAQGYEPVMRWQRPVWTIAALVQQGRAYETLAHAIVTVEIPSPPGAPAAFITRFREAAEPQVAPIECLAVVRYLLAVRAGRAGAIDSPYTRVAMRRLTRYPSVRITQCVEDQRTRDPAFAAFHPDELPPPKDD